jgi:hypothetical protein
MHYLVYGYASIVLLLINWLFYVFSLFCVLLFSEKETVMPDVVMINFMAGLSMLVDMHNQFNLIMQSV